MIAYGITNNVLQKTNFLFGYKINPTIDSSVRIENASWRKYPFSLSEILQHLDLYRVDVVAKHDANIKYGVEVIIFLFRLSSVTRTNLALMRPYLWLSTAISSSSGPPRSE